MNSQCPSCSHQFPRSSRGKELGGLWNPRVVACPSCGTRVQWVPLYWRMQLLGALFLGPAMFRGFSGSTRLICLGISLSLVAVAMVMLRLRRVEEDDSQSS